MGFFFHDNKELPKKYAHPYFNIIDVGRTEKVKGQDLLLKAIKRSMIKTFAYILLVMEANLII